MATAITADMHFCVWSHAVFQGDVMQKNLIALCILLFASTAIAGTSQLPLRGNTLIFDGVPDAATPVPLDLASSGSRLTIVASGTTGQTVDVYGSNDGVNWTSSIATLTVGTAGADYAYISSTFMRLRLVGSARVSVARGRD